MAYAALIIAGAMWTGLTAFALTLLRMSKLSEERAVREREAIAKGIYLVPEGGEEE